MDYSEYLADRVRSSLKENRAAYEEKKMFGGSVGLLVKNHVLLCLRKSCWFGLPRKTRMNIWKKMIAV